MINTKYLNHVFQKTFNDKLKTTELNDIVIKRASEEITKLNASRFKITRSFNPLDTTVREIVDTMVCDAINMLLKFKTDYSTQLYLYPTNEYYTKQILHPLDFDGDGSDDYMYLYTQFEQELNPQIYSVNLVFLCRYDVLNTLLNQHVIKPASTVELMDGELNIVERYIRY